MECPGKGWSTGVLGKDRMRNPVVRNQKKRPGSCVRDVRYGVMEYWSNGVMEKERIQNPVARRQKKRPGS